MTGTKAPVNGAWLALGATAALAMADAARGSRAKKPSPGHAPDFNLCVPRAIAKLHALKISDPDAKILQLSGHKPDRPEGTDPRWKEISPRYWVHYAVYSKGTIYDCAPRQFGGSEDERRMTPAECREIWEQITVIPEKDLYIKPGRGSRARKPASVFYRGTRRPDVQGHQAVSSWTPSLGAALIWSSNPGLRGALEPGSTIHAATLPAKTKVLDLTHWGISWSLRDLAEVLGWPDGMTEEDGRKLLNHLHQRKLGRTKLSHEFQMKAYLPNGAEVEDEDLGFSLLMPETFASWILDDLEDLHGAALDDLVRFAADSFAFADSPTVRRLAQAQGYGAISYLDVFSGGTWASPKILDMEIEEVPGVSMEDDLEWDEHPAHVTMRPFVPMTPLWSRPAAEVLREFKGGPR